MREAQKKSLLFLLLVAAGALAAGFGLLGHSLPADSDHPAGPAGVAMHPRPPGVAVVAAAAGAAAPVKERGRCDNDMMCTLELSPVCVFFQGRNQTFGNPCKAARCGHGKTHQAEGECATAAPPLSALPDGPAWKPLAVEWQDTQLGPGFPDPISSSWSDVGVLGVGHVIRIEADGFNNDAPKKIANWGWYINVWSGDGRHWTTTKGAKEPSRLLHFNPRPRPGYVAINNFLKGKGWGKEVDTPVPEPWKKENHAAKFVLELEVGAETWVVRLNGEPQPKLSFVRAGLEHFAGPLVLQVYDLLNPRVSLRDPIVSS